MLKPTSRVLLILVVLILPILYLSYNILNTKMTPWIQHRHHPVDDDQRQDGKDDLDNLDIILNTILTAGSTLSSTDPLEMVEGGIGISERKEPIDMTWSVRKDIRNGSVLDGKGLKNRSMFVIVMAQMRTGSTIVGQMFNQNREFFYFFEPLYPVNFLIDQKIIPAEQRRSAQIVLLRDMSRCKFSPRFVRIIQSWGGRLENRALAPICLRKATCKWSPSLFQEVCHRHKERLAVKSIRTDLLHIRPLVEEHGVDVRVIHLVRDPRGTANSRVQYELMTSHLEQQKNNQSRSEVTADIFQRLLRKNIISLCEQMVRNADEVAKEPAWLQGRYTRVRYEDFASTPLKTTQNVYSFLDLELPDNVKIWLMKATGEHAEKDSRMSLFNQHKSSKVAAARWRYTLSADQIKQIEDSCEEAMRLYGYERFNDTK